MNILYNFYIGTYTYIIFLFGPGYQSSKMLKRRTRATRVRISPSRESSYYIPTHAADFEVHYTIYLQCFFGTGLFFFSTLY